MSCPNWERLLTEREAVGEDSREWNDAVAHLRTCDTCRERVFRLDPTLLFRDLPEPRPGEDEGDRMVVVVESLLHRRRLRSRRWMTVARRAAAAAVLVAASLLALPARQGRDAKLPSEPSPAAQGGGFSRVLPAESGGTSLQAWQSSSARVYEMGTPEMAFVMVVDDTLKLEPAG